MVEFRKVMASYPAATFRLHLMRAEVFMYRSVFGSQLSRRALERPRSDRRESDVVARDAMHDTLTSREPVQVFSCERSCFELRASLVSAVFAVSLRTDHW